jgi:hypothetical protein
MHILQGIIRILGDTEKALASLASEAAKTSDYDGASCLIDLAREVTSLASKARSQLDPNAQSQNLRADWIPLGKPVSQSRTRSHAKRTEYPKFLRDGDNLVKLAWSPSEKAEYEHRSPKKNIPLLVSAISKIASNGRRFSMDRVLPLVDPGEGGRQVPDYQAYLCLAWLKTLGFLTRHGRQGYSLTTRAPIEPLVETHWAALSPR